MIFINWKEVPDIRLNFADGKRLYSFAIYCYKDKYWSTWALRNAEVPHEIAYISYDSNDTCKFCRLYDRYKS